MRQFRKILFVIEPGVSNIHAAERSVELARSSGAELTIVAVNPELPRSLANLRRTYRKTHEEQLMLPFVTIDSRGVTKNTKLLTGTPIIEIIKEVQKNAYDLIIKSAEGSSGLFNKLFGVTDMSLLRQSPCPVWIVKPTKTRRISRIVTAVDPDPHIPENLELNRAILERAISLAREEKCELHIVHSWFLRDEEMLRSTRTGLTRVEVDYLEGRAREEHKRWFDELIAQYDLEGITSETYLIKGEPKKDIPQLARKTEAELIVMGTLSRTGIAGFLIGNTAEKTLESVDCSVLTVKPRSRPALVRM